MKQQTFNDPPQKGVMTKMLPAEPLLLASVVGSVYFELVQAGHKAGAEKWSRCHRHRTQIMDRVFEKWCEMSTHDSIFPWSEDFVIDIYVAFRKLDDSSKLKWQKYLN